jgi:hypothetical protein
VDVIDKAAGRDECRARLLSSLQRAADEAWRGVRRVREPAPAHRLVRVDRRHIEVDGHEVRALTGREADILEALIERPNLPIKAELLESCFSPDARQRSGAGYNPLNKVHTAVSRLRRKIDVSVGRAGVGAALIRTPHRGAITTYELRGLITDRVDPRASHSAESVEALDERVSLLTRELLQLRREVSDLRRGTPPADAAEDGNDG